MRAARASGRLEAFKACFRAPPLPLSREMVAMHRRVTREERVEAARATLVTIILEALEKSNNLEFYPEKGRG